MHRAAQVFLAEVGRLGGWKFSSMGMCSGNRFTASMFVWLVTFALSWPTHRTTNPRKSQACLSLGLNITTTVPGALARSALGLVGGCRESPDRVEMSSVSHTCFACLRGAWVDSRGHTCGGYPARPQHFCGSDKIHVRSSYCSSPISTIPKRPRRTRPVWICCPCRAKTSQRPRLVSVPCSRLLF